MFTWGMIFELIGIILMVLAAAPPPATPPRYPVNWWYVGWALVLFGWLIVDRLTTATPLNHPLVR